MRGTLLGRPHRMGLEALHRRCRPPAAVLVAIFGVGLLAEVVVATIRERML